MLDNDYENQINNGIASSFITMHYGPTQDSRRLLILVVDDRFPIVFNEITLASLTPLGLNDNIDTGLLMQLIDSEIKDEDKTAA